MTSHPLKQLKRFIINLYHTFTTLEWVMIVLTSASAIFDIYVALLWRDEEWGLAIPLSFVAVVLTAIIQAIWIKCLRKMTHK